MGPDEAVHVNVQSKVPSSLNASLRCGWMVCDCKLAGLSSVTKQELVMATETISHYDQTSIFLSVATGNKVQCFTAPEQITHDDIYQLSDYKLITCLCSCSCRISLDLKHGFRLLTRIWRPTSMGNQRPHLKQMLHLPPRFTLTLYINLFEISVPEQQQLLPTVETFWNICIWILKRTQTVMLTNSLVGIRQYFSLYKI